MLQEPVKDSPETRDLSRFLSLYNSETDRGAALTACAHFDTLLERILNANLLPGKQTNELIAGFSAPLGSFSARISMCRALALLESHECDELTVMRRIRNKFGHDLECNDFDHLLVRDLVDQLPWLGPTLTEQKQTRRQRFNFAAAILACDLREAKGHCTFVGGLYLSGAFVQLVF